MQTTEWETSPMTCKTGKNEADALASDDEAKIVSSSDPPQHQPPILRRVLSKVRNVPVSRFDNTDLASSLRKKVEIVEAARALSLVLRETDEMLIEQHIQKFHDIYVDYVVKQRVQSTLAMKLVVAEIEERIRNVKAGRKEDRLRSAAYKFTIVGAVFTVVSAVTGVVVFSATLM